MHRNTLEPCAVCCLCPGATCPCTCSATRACQRPDKRIDAYRTRSTIKCLADNADSAMPCTLAGPVLTMHVVTPANESTGRAPHYLNAQTADTYRTVRKSDLRATCAWEDTKIPVARLMVTHEGLSRPRCCLMSSVETQHIRSCGVVAHLIVSSGRKTTEPLRCLSDNGESVASATGVGSLNCFQAAVAPCLTCEVKRATLIEYSAAPGGSMGRSF